MDRCDEGCDSLLHRREGRAASGLSGGHAKPVASAVCLAALVAVSTSLPPAPANAPGSVETAQLQIPKPTTDGGKDKPLQRFVHEYSYGTQSDIVYRRDPDINRRVRDDTLIVTPDAIGLVTYRPTDGLETRLEVILDREIAAKEERAIIPPNGETQMAPDRRFSLLIDQAHVTVKNIIAPFELTVGRATTKTN